MDPFNWPSAGRRDLMNLSTIRPEDKLGKTGRISSNLRTDDVDGARPFIAGYKYNNKDTFVNRTEDIAGSSPKRQHLPLDKPYYYMTNEDIAGTQPAHHKFVSSRIGASSPLEPIYRLPEVEIRPPTPPKFVRDAMAITDIEGAHPKSSTRFQFAQRDIMKKDDIEGSHPRPGRESKNRIDRFDVSSINKEDQFHTKRSTNPLEPTYTHTVQRFDLTPERVEIGKVEGSQPRQLHPPMQNPRHPETRQSFYNETKDIFGAQSTTLRVDFYRRDTRKEFRDVTKTADIEGARAGSLKKGIQTKRVGNPQERLYIYPGHTEEIPNNNRSPGATGGTMLTKTFNASEKTVKSSEVTAAPEPVNLVNTNVQSIQVDKPIAGATPVNNAHNASVFSQNASRNIMRETADNSGVKGIMGKVIPRTETHFAAAQADFHTNKNKFYDTTMDHDPYHTIGGEMEKTPHINTVKAPRKYDLKNIHPLEIRRSVGNLHDDSRARTNAEKMDRFVNMK